MGGMGKLEVVLENNGPAPLAVPYFSQGDPQWGSQEYDHASVDGPFFCGSTLTGCGCAVSSAAMLLKYYGVDRAPDGSPTTPGSLNQWLKNNNGYSFGNVRWASVGSFSLKSNETYGTPKIRFVGFGEGNNFDKLKNELNSGRPVILREPNHYVIASETNGISYSINDPAYLDKVTLSSYSNAFQQMVLYELTHTDLSTIYLTAPAPTQILLVDEAGRRVGKDPATGVVHSEIPNSFYFVEPSLADDISGALPTGGGVTTLAIINPATGSATINIFGNSGNYGVSFAGYDKDGNISVTNYSGNNNKFSLDFSPVPGSKIAVRQIVSVDIKPGKEPNPINPKGGVIPVAILSTPSFDAKTVDSLSVRFGPNGAKEVHNRGHYEDVDGNGDVDLVLHFKTSDSGIGATDRQACLDGKTFLGFQISGCDKIRVLQ